MENASKALLIAAAVLVVIILVAVGMKIYSSTSGTQKVATDTGKTISDKTGDAKDLAISEITGKKANKNIKYYNQNNEMVKQEDLQPGYDIVIGETERFKIFSVTDNEIKAMPYYNLKITETPIKQATEKDTETSTGTCEFSLSIHDENNNIQQYITAYKENLKSKVIYSFDVKIASLSDLPLDNTFYSSDDRRNPGHKGYYWTNSVADAFGNIYYIGSNGTIYNAASSNKYGVRPIIVISK